MNAQMSLEDCTLDPLLDAIAWVAVNADAWAQVLAWHAEDVAAGVDPCIDLYVNLLRRQHFARKLGLTRTDAVYLVNNNLRSSLARLGNRDYGCSFPTRKASVDRGDAA